MPESSSSGTASLTASSTTTPGQDNIVRVEARLLRKRLEAYFEDEGKDEPVTIVMPRGSYALSFELRTHQKQEAADDQAAEQLRRSWSVRSSAIAAGTVLAICVAGLAWSLVSATVNRDELTGGPALPLSALEFQLDSARRGMFRNRSPRSGERPFYAMSSDSGESGRAFAQVAFVPNLNGQGHAVLIAGTTAEGTEAAGEFILDPARTGAAFRSMKIDRSGSPRSFEILLEVNAIAGTASQSRAITTRLLPE
jgi:hypothetical protein